MQEEVLRQEVGAMQVEVESVKSERERQVAQVREEIRIEMAGKDKEIRKLRELNDRYRLVIEAMRRQMSVKEEVKV
jgi:hypothetical protein